MARPYANDLRRKFLQAYEQGKGTLGELAEQFGVSEGWGQEDLGHPHAHGADRAATVATWSGEPGDSDGAGVDAGANP